MVSVPKTELTFLVKLVNDFFVLTMLWRGVSMDADNVLFRIGIFSSDIYHKN